MDVCNPQTLVLLAPVMPAATGNGLAMRAGAQLLALSEVYDVSVVVVPVAGGSLDDGWTRCSASSVAVVPPGVPADLRSGIVQLMANAAWRERFVRSEPLPATARIAGPALAGAVAAAAGGRRGARIHALRASLAPLAVAVAERLEAPWATLDLDDDDEHLLERAGRDAEAEAYGRMLRTFGREFAWLSLAAPEDAARVAARHALPTVVVPNSVVVPPALSGRSRRDPSRASLLFVGNLTYEPNVEAAEALVRDILPRVRDMVERPVGVELVGACEPGGRVAALASFEAVEVRGHVEDLAAAYAGADVAVVPLEHGSGTRIKLLEALAAGVPVVTTPVGAAGLGAVSERHLLIASGAHDLAAATARVLGDEQLAAALVREGRVFVEERYGAEVASRGLRRLVTALDAPSGDQAAGDEL